jgi:hypothetical protein
MPLKMHCPSCHRSLRVPSQQAGQTVRCPNCGSKLTAPDPSPAVVEKEEPRGGQPGLSTLKQPDQASTLASGPPPLRGRSIEPPPQRRQPEVADSVPPPPPLPPPPLHAYATPAYATPAEGLLLAPPPPLPPASGTSPPLPPNPTEEALPGVEHSWIRRWPVYQLGMWVIAAAVVNAIPALLDIVALVRHDASAGISRWALALLLASGLQAVYAAYLLPLPDWGTAWVMSIVMLVFATGYAALLGALTLANQQSQLVQFLEVGDMLPGGQATLWCLAMLSVYSLLAYFSGRISFRWRRTYWRWANG